VGQTLAAAQVAAQEAVVVLTLMIMAVLAVQERQGHHGRATTAEAELVAFLMLLEAVAVEQVKLVAEAEPTAAVTAVTAWLLASQALPFTVLAVAVALPGKTITEHTV
jgi:hypothetical protein